MRGIAIAWNAVVVLVLALPRPNAGVGAVLDGCASGTKAAAKGAVAAPLSRKASDILIDRSMVDTNVDDERERNPRRQTTAEKKSADADEVNQTRNRDLTE